MGVGVGCPEVFCGEVGGSSITQTGIKVNCEVWQDGRVIGNCQWPQQRGARHGHRDLQGGDRASGDQEQEDGEGGQGGREGRALPPAGLLPQWVACGKVNPLVSEAKHAA